jgi:hypothetical protein
MSFAVSLDEGAIEWSSDNVRTLKGKRYVQVHSMVLGHMAFKQRGMGMDHMTVAAPAPSF